MELSFRVAFGTDVEHLARMNRRLILDEQHRNPMSDKEFLNRMRNWLKGDEYEALFFEMNERLVGYALYCQRTDHIYLRQFFVDPAYRRQGVGRSALGWLRRERWPEGKRVRLDVLAGNDRAKRFWKSVGFCDYSFTMEAEGA